MFKLIKIMILGFKTTWVENGSVSVSYHYKNDHVLLLEGNKIMGCNSCKKGFNGRAGNGYQPCSCELKANQEEPYGRCPVCNAKGVSRERRIDGNDRCANGHCYKSSEALMGNE